MNTATLALVFLAAAQPTVQNQRAASAAGVTTQGDIREAAQRIVATLQLAAQEYRLAWRGSTLVNRAEWEEARLFVAEARRSASELPPDLAAELDRTLERLGARLASRLPPDSLALEAAAVERRLAEALGFDFDDRPRRSPSLASGERIFRLRCSSCHGETGRGDGPAGAALQPAPPDLTAAERQSAATPLDLYRRVTHGVPGTAMPAFEHDLSREQRWDAVAFVQALSDTLARRGGSGQLAISFGAVRGTLGAAMRLAASGAADAASRKVLDAYMAFEAVEARLGATDPAIVQRAEDRFAALRTAAARGGYPLTQAVYADLLVSLQEAEAALTLSRSPVGLFAESLLLMLREGFEAILVIGAIMAVLGRAGAQARRRNVRWGVVAALAASLLTAAALEWLFVVSAAQREALEGAVMLVAAAVLFYVSYWLVSKIELAAWTRFVRERIRRAAESGSALALAGVAFLAVYREGFETVLFYKALLVTGGALGAGPILAGMTIGLAGLVALYLGIERFGLRVPMRPFFAVTGAMLAYLALVFSGKGIRELQEGGYVGVTRLHGAPSSAFLGLYPTIETLAVQGVMLLAIAAALIWAFLVQPRRMAAAASDEGPAGTEAAAGAEAEASAESASSRPPQRGAAV